MGENYCLACHESREEKAGGGHANVPCVDCHYLGVPHAEGEKREFAAVVLKSARGRSELIFRALYTVMSKGWDKEKISEMMAKLNMTNPDMTIMVFRGAPVIREFGDIEGQREIRESDPDIMKALREGKEALTSRAGNRVRYIYPVVVKEECLKCHNEGAAGDVNGVIDITFTVKTKQQKKGEAVKPEALKISELVREDARQASDMVFESLLTVMGRGWDSAQIREMIVKFSNNELNMDITLYRGQAAEEKLGGIAGEREKRESDPKIMEALRSGKNVSLVGNGDKLRFLYPIQIEGVCANCHGDYNRNKTIGLIDITFPTKRLKIHGLVKLADMPIDRSQRVCTICHEYLPSRPKDFPQQVLALHLEEQGMEDKNTSCVECHDPHVPGM